MLKFLVSSAIVDAVQPKVTHLAIPDVEVLAVDSQGRRADLSEIEAADRWDLDADGFRRL